MIEVDTLDRVIELVDADQTVIGWEAAVMTELKQMRAQMPHGTRFIVRLEGARTPDTQA